MESNKIFLELSKITQEFSRVNAAFMALGAAAGAAAGALAGYKRAVRQLEEHYARQADAEIAEAKRHYRQVYKAEEYASPEAAAEALGLDEAVQALRDYQGLGQEGGEPPIKFDYTRVVPQKPDLTEVVRNVFTDADVVKELDLEKEMKTREPEKPYLVNQDEFYGNETEFRQVTVTWYEGDQVLADDKDQPVDFDVDEVIGLENLKRFGEGSGDRNIVLVRNNTLQIDYEIVRSTGEYSKEVAGFDEEETTEIIHSHRPPRRFRVDDD